MSMVSNGTVSKKISHWLQINKMVFFFPFVWILWYKTLSMKRVDRSLEGSYSLNILSGEEFLIYKSLESSCQSNSLLGTVHSFSLCFQIHKCLADLKKEKRLVAIVKHFSKNKHVMLIFSC